MGRAVIGTVALVIALAVLVIPVPYLAKLPALYSLGGLFLKLLGGVLIFAFGLMEYERAAFPPGMAIEDPFAEWVHNKLLELKRRNLILWFLALLVLMFTPILTVICLPVMLLRPFYVSLTQGAPLVPELIKTGKFLIEMAKGLFVLTACACMGVSAMLLTLAVLIYQLRAA